VITADELIALQAKVKQVYQGNACWIMHPDTFLAVKLLKDANKRYLLQDDITGTFPHILLGKPIFLSDNMPKTAAGEKAVLYGDLSGLSVNIREKLEIQVLREKYATMHALGVVAWMEADSKVTDHQRMAVLQMAGTAATATTAGDETE
jgi:HK97 family phage major capsid protein